MTHRETDTPKPYREVRLTSPCVVTALATEFPEDSEYGAWIVADYDDSNRGDEWAEPLTMTLGEARRVGIEFLANWTSGITDVEVIDAYRIWYASVDIGTGEENQWSWLTFSREDNSD